MNQMRSFLMARQRIFQIVVILGLALAAGGARSPPRPEPICHGKFSEVDRCACYAISVVAIVALGATLAFASSGMGETMKRLLRVGIPVCCVVFAAQVMSSFIGQAAEISFSQPIHA